MEGLNEALLQSLSRSLTASVRPYDITKPEIYADDHSGLLQAVARKNTSKVGELLRFAKTYDSNGFTALMYAALDGYEDGVRMLMGLEHGMRVSGSYSYGAYTFVEPTATMLACMHGHRGVIELLKSLEAGLAERGMGVTALVISSIFNRSECAEALRDVEAGCIDVNGRTALMWAAYRGNSMLVRLLRDAEAGLTDTLGKTALVYAAEYGNLACVKDLADLEGKAHGSKAIAECCKGWGASCIFKASIIQFLRTYSE
ncbi:Protein 21.1 [Giardia lamblia P15]|uniref:Protein 21.1 n=1 Tax=Giardia intestinalis (strain P15) TaxID=658858 RepID=E1F6M9_GIAIA|nr:Protein 21.1 [Giardia lamblia P15]